MLTFAYIDFKHQKLKILALKINDLANVSQYYDEMWQIRVTKKLAEQLLIKTKEIVELIIDKLKTKG